MLQGKYVEMLPLRVAEVQINKYNWTRSLSVELVENLTDKERGGFFGDMFLPVAALDEEITIL